MKSNLFLQAHKMTREDKVNYPEINYRIQFGINLVSLYSKKTMMELTGSEKQIKWAEDIRRKMLDSLEELKNNDETLNSVGFKKEEVETAIENIKKIDSAKTFIDKRYDTRWTFINNYKTIIVTESDLEKIRESSRIMNRIKEIKEGIEKGEHFAELTQGMIHKKVWTEDESGRKAQMIFDMLVAE